MSGRLVTVCASCRRACCLLVARFRCEAAGPTTDLPLSTLRELRLEHPSYLKHQPGDDPDVPKDVEDIVWLAEYWQKRDETAKEPGMFVGYLTEELGVDPALVKSALLECWPEAAALVRGAA